MWILYYIKNTYYKPRVWIELLFNSEYRRGVIAIKSLIYKKNLKSRLALVAIDILQPMHPVVSNKWVQEYQDKYETSLLPAIKIYKNYVINGHHRLQAAKNLGRKEIVCEVLE